MSDQLIREIKKGNHEKLSHLLAETPVNWQTYDKKTGKNLLQLAIEADCPRTLEILLSCPGANVNNTDRECRETTLQTAVLMNNLQLIERLLERQANPLMANRNGENAVHSATKLNLPRVLELFLRKGTNLSAVKSDEGSLLNLAIKNRCEQTALWLLTDKAVDVQLNAKGSTGDNCLLLAVKENLSNVVAQILRKLAEDQRAPLEKQLFLNAQDEHGDTVLHIAARNEYLAVKSMLEEKGKPMGLNDEILNLKRETSKSVEVTKLKEAEQEIKQKEKSREQKKLREREKQEEKQRQVQQAEEQERQKKEQIKQMKLLQVEMQQKKLQKDSRTRWYLLGGFIVVVVLLYLWLDWQIKLRRSRSGVIE